MGHIPRGTLNFFSGRYVQPGFPNLGACERINCHESGCLWADFHQKQGLENWYLQNFQAFWQKLQSNLNFWSWKLSFSKKWLLLEGKCPVFLSNEDLVNGLVIQLGVLWTAGEVWKGGLEGCNPCTPFSGECPPPPRGHITGRSRYGPIQSRPPPPLLTTKSCKSSLFQGYISQSYPNFNTWAHSFCKSWIQPCILWQWVSYIDLIWVSPYDIIWKLFSVSWVSNEGFKGGHLPWDMPRRACSKEGTCLGTCLGGCKIDHHIVHKVFFILKLY